MRTEIGGLCTSLPSRGKLAADQSKYSLVILPVTHIGEISVDYMCIKALFQGSPVVTFFDNGSAVNIMTNVIYETKCFANYGFK